MYKKNIILYFLIVLILILAVSFSGTDSLSISDSVCGDKFPLNLIGVVPENFPGEISQANKIRTIKILNLIRPKTIEPKFIIASASVVKENFSFFKSCIQGSFSQTDPRFGESAGIQCACNTLVSLCWSANRRANIWKTSDLDFILTKGNELFEFVNLKRSLYFDELPKNLSGIEFRIEFSRVDNGFFQKETNSFDVFVDINIFFRNDIVGALLFFNDYTVSFLKDDKKNIYIFDSHGRDSFGQPSPEGKSILKSFLSFRDVFTISYKYL